MRIQVRALVFVLLGATTAAGQGADQGHDRTGTWRASGAIVPTGIATLRGQEVPYEVVDGLAVYGGDMVLGTVEEVVARYGAKRSRKLSTAGWPERRDLSVARDEYLWPNGVIPYVIDSRFNEKGLRRIRTAIAEWNTETVINLVERTTEFDYVRFVPGGSRCASMVGRVGGEQRILLKDADGCSVSSTIHEIGHAVGLLHEHQRLDRWRYVTVSETQRFGPRWRQYRPLLPSSRSYDYASVMHYKGVATIPPGMPVRSGRLSRGDVDGVSRLYGTVPRTTTVSTNPPGLEVVIDGERMVTPVRLEWSAGSQHTVEAVSPQTVGGYRFVYGRWNDDGGREHSVIAGPESTWFEANYIVQRRMLACSDPREAGTVTFKPASPDGFLVVDQPVSIEADRAPASSREFVRWRPPPSLWRPPDRHHIPVLPGPSSNPAAGSPWFWDAESSRLAESVAVFDTTPRFLIESNVDGMEILVDGIRETLPWAVAADAYLDGVLVEAPASVPEESELGARDVRYRFESWSDGGGRAHKVTVPATGGRVRLEATREYRLRARVRTDIQSGEPAILITPSSEDGFYPEGARVTVEASLPSGWRFAGWVGEVSGTEPRQSFVMDSAKSLEAIFTRGEQLRRGETQSVMLQHSDRFRLDSGYSVVVPADAAELTVRFQSSADAEVDLYVRRGLEVSLEQQDGDGSPRILADFESNSAGASETIQIRRESALGLVNDIYYIGLAVPPEQQGVRGSLSAEIRRSGIVRAEPRALAFVSPPGSAIDPQTVEVTHDGAGAVRYKIDSDASWLTASPLEWVSAGTGVQQISVETNSAGLDHDTRQGTLTVLQAGSGNGSSSWTSTGIEIPVALAVVPVNGSGVDSGISNAVRIASRPPDGDTYGAGEAIEARVDFPAPVYVTGSPTLALRVGDRIRQLPWNKLGWQSDCEGGYTSLSFGYVVQADDLDTDGVSIATDALTLNGGTIRTADGSDAAIRLAALDTGGASGQKVDGNMVVVPRVTGVWIKSRPQDGDSYGLGEEIWGQVRFSQPVEMTGSPTLALTVGPRTPLASLSSGGDRNLWFSHTVQAGDTDADGIGITAGALALNGGSIRSLAGGDAALDLGSNAIADDPEHAVDGTKVAAPIVTGSWITSRPQDGSSYALGEKIRVRVQFSQAVETTGSPTLALTVGARTRLASLSSGGDRNLWFGYTVQADDSDADGIGVLAGAVALNGGSIRSAAGLDAALDLGSYAFASDAGHKVDGSKVAAPIVTGVWIRSRPQDGTSYGLGEEIWGQVQFDQEVETTGSPTLALTMDAHTRSASLSSQGGRNLWFSYTVRAGDTDADGIGIRVDALALNGGSIRTPAGADAALGLGSYAFASDAEHKVDGSKVAAPVVTGVWIWSRPHDGTAYGLGEEIWGQIQFSQTIEMTGSPALALTMGARTRSASLSSQGGRNLWFSYTVQGEDTDADGISILAGALALNGGRIRNTAGADATLGLGSHAVVNDSSHRVDGGG